MSDVAASSLRALQRTFAAALRGPTSGASRRRPRLRLAGADRMHVYVDAYAARLVEVLAGDYGAVRSLLGEQSFERLARAYVRAHPSRHPNLNVFGRHFPAFLRRQRGLAANVGQVARLELALARAFDAPAAPPLVVDTLATTPAHRLARARLHVHPSVQLLRLPAAAVDAYAAWRSGAARTGAARPGWIDLLVVRSADGVVRHELRRDAVAVLRALQRGEPLGRALAAVRAEAPLATWFATWRTAGVFTGAARAAANAG